MERRDYLMTQIQQLGRFLRILIERFIGKSAPADLETEMNQMNESFTEKCGFDISILSSPNFEELRNEILNRNAYNSENIELLADFMVTLINTSQQGPISLISRLKSNALKLYEFIEVSDKTYSIERRTKMEEVKRNLI
jgi:hypothetical protein